MSKKILLLLTAKDKADKVLGGLMREDIEKVFLCPIGYGTENLAEQIINSLAKEKPGFNFERVDFLTKFNKGSFELKPEYINFIHDASEREFINGFNLKRYFVYPDQDVSAWWFSLVSEKNQYKSNAFTFFSQILTILHLKKELNCGEIWLSKGCGIIYAVLADLKREVAIFPSGFRYRLFCAKDIEIIFVEIMRAANFTFHLIRKILSLRKFSGYFNRRKDSFRNSDIACVTMFPFLDNKELVRGRFANLAYGSLQTALNQCHKSGIVWLGMYTPINAYNWSKALKYAEQVKENEIFYLLEEWLGFRELCKILGIYARLACRCIKKLGKYNPLFIYKDKTTGLEIDFWKIINKDFLSSFLGKMLIWEISNYEMFSKIVNDLPQNSKIIYFAEMHAWEKALNAACSKRRDVVRVGLQHTIVPLLLLNYFDHPDDLGGQNYIKYSPSPNYLGCVGTVTKNLFLKNRWPEEKLFVLGGFRFCGLKDREYNFDILKRGQKKNQIIVAFSISPQENKELLSLVCRAFNDKEINYKILLKSHPCYPVDRLARKMGLGLNSRIFEFTDKPLQEVVPESKMMVVKESSSIFWAIYNKIPVVVPFLYCIVDLCPISGVSGLAHYITNQEELFALADNIMHNGEEVGIPEYESFFNRYLEIYSDEKRYYENLVGKIRQ